MLIMNRSIALLIIAILMNSVLLSAYAANVYKWVDAKGITHYSDEEPAPSTTQVTLIDVPATQSVTVNAENDYYSIANQWMRLHEELIKQEKIKLEKAKQKAALQPVAPQVIYINEPNANRYVVAYPGLFHRRHGRSRFHHKPKHYSGDMPGKYPRGEGSGKLHWKGSRLGSNKHRNASGLVFKRNL